MRSMINKVCRHIRNYFPEVEAHEGHFVIENQQISLPFCTEGDYVLIEGSKRNDGIFQWVEGRLDFLVDEEFDGRITIRAIPEDFEELIAEIDGYMSNHDVPTEYISESFAGYSYQKASNGKGGVADWTDIFRSRLNGWRKL